jgi:Skp family chaperone for outer membrane proteins
MSCGTPDDDPPSMELKDMNRTIKIACLAAVAMVSSSYQALAAAPPAASASAPLMVPGLGVANIDAIVAGSEAFKASQRQRQITYRSQIDAGTARSQAINLEIKPLQDKFNRDRQMPGTNLASLQQQAQAIQAKLQNGQQEVNKLLEPLALSDTYVNEQIRDKLDLAIKAAMAKSRVSIVFTPNNVIGFNNAYNLSPAILAELNALIPTLDIRPPAGWQQRAVRQAQTSQVPGGR